MAGLTTEGPTYTADQVGEALNRAVSDISQAVNINESAVLDAMNLLVNVGLCYLDGSADTVADAIEESYAVRADDLDDGETLVDHVLGWLE